MFSICASHASEAYFIPDSYDSALPLSLLRLKRLNEGIASLRCSTKHGAVVMDWQRAGDQFVVNPVPLGAALVFFVGWAFLAGWFLRGNQIASLREQLKTESKRLKLAKDQQKGMQRQIKELKGRMSQEVPVIDDLKNIAAAQPIFEKLSNATQAVSDILSNLERTNDDLGEGPWIPCYGQLLKAPQLLGGP
jgi:hypothetical protein